MKIKKGFILKQLTEDLCVVIAVGEASKKINGYAKLSESAVVLWNKLEQGASFDELVNALLNEYEVDEKTARQGVSDFLDRLRLIEAIDE